MNIEEINQLVNSKSYLTDTLLGEVGKVIVGQNYMIRRMMIGLLTNGHILVEGVPGLAKTLAINTMAKSMQASFKRLQFTPDLLPADIIGTMIYNQKTGEFQPKKGPVFANFILADEINRAPAKVQSALLEAMQEKQVTISETTFELPKPFLVMATQNPIEQEGTYPLPEAQVDRFMMKLIIKYPSRDEERQIMNRMVNENDIPLRPVLNIVQIEEMKDIIKEIHMENKLQDYILDLVFATREPQKYKNLKQLATFIEFGASPRASLYMARAAKAHAFLEKRGYVIPDDIKAVGKDVLRHRIILNYEAEAEQMTQDDIVNKIFDEIEVP